MNQRWKPPKPKHLAKLQWLCIQLNCLPDYLKPCVDWQATAASESGQCFISIAKQSKLSVVTFISCSWLYCGSWGTMCLEPKVRSFGQNNKNMAGRKPPRKCYLQLFNAMGGSWQLYRQDSHSLSVAQLCCCWWCVTAVETSTIWALRLVVCWSIKYCFQHSNISLWLLQLT